MVWPEKTDPAPGSAAIYGAPDIKKIMQLFNGVADVENVTIDTSFEILNGKLKIATLTNVGLLTVPAGPTTLIGTDTTDTLSNKSLDNTCDVDDAALSANIPTLTGTQVLTNKELTDPKITNGSTGAGTADLSTNCPAVDPTAPYTWLKMKSSDGSDVYVPAFK